MPVHVQTTPLITGSVFDSKTRAPIAGASVYCMRYPDHPVTSSSDGSFRMPPIKEWQLVPIASDLMDPFCKLVTEASGYGADIEYISLDREQPTLIYLHQARNKP